MSKLKTSQFGKKINDEFTIKNDVNSNEKNMNNELEPIIEAPVIKKIRATVGEIKPFQFESIEDEDGFI